MAKDSISRWQKNFNVAQRLLYLGHHDFEKHALKALECAEAAANQEQIAKSLAILSAFYIKNEREEAETTVRRSVESAQRAFGSDSDEYCDQLLCLAMVMDAKGNIGAALAFRAAALDIVEASNQLDGVIEIFDTLIYYFMGRGWYQQAEMYFHRAMRARSKFYGQDSDEWASQLPVYLAILRGQGEYAKVEILLEKLGPEARDFDARCRGVFDGHFPGLSDSAPPKQSSQANSLGFGLVPLQTGKVRAH